MVIKNQTEKKLNKQRQVGGFEKRMSDQSRQQARAELREAVLNTVQQWFCNKCKVEVRGVRCQHCGKDYEENS